MLFRAWPNPRGGAASDGPHLNGLGEIIMVQVKGGSDAAIGGGSQE